MAAGAFGNRGARGALAALLLGPVSCIGYSDVKRDTDRHPRVDTGVSATILYPGQAPPPMGWPPATGAPGQSAPAPAGSSSAGGASSGSSAGPVMIGGAESDETRHKDVHSEPLWYHPLWAPFAIVLYPIRKVRDWLSRDEAPAPVESSAAPPPPAPRQDVQAAYERAQLEALRRQIESQGAAPPPAPGPVAGAPSPGPSSSIAAELEALRRRAGGGAPSATGGTETWRPAAPLPRPPTPPAGVADRVHDRNDDGRPDHWQYRDGGQLVREVFDDDADGTPDRTVFYEPKSGETLRVEEDANHDGRVDSWAYYEDGHLARRRADADGDGAVDHWTFHRGDRLLRDERDTNGDGFRDRVDVYENGKLVRRDEDRDGDGRADRVTRFDASGAPSELEEDRDGDGRVDVRSSYRKGRLVRRELLSELAAQEALSPLPRLDAPERPGEPPR